MTETVAPLSGTRVVELGTMITAPLAGMMLGDLGAEIVKVERAGGGDPFRSFNGTLYSPHFVAFNRNKLSKVLDLQSQAGREELLELVRQADVLIDNFRPGVMDRLNLGRAILAQANPALVHCSITGFGAVGPYSKRPAYDTVGQALSGIAGLSIDPAAPKFSGTTVADNVTGMYACYAIMAALLERERTGRGRHVEVNMLEASAAFMPDAFMNLEMLGMVNDPFTRVSFSQAYVVRCGDGKLLAIHLSSPDKFWKALLSVIDDAAIAGDERFATREGRVGNYSELSDRLQQAFARRPRNEWIDLLGEADVPFAAVNRVDEAMADPQLEALGTFRAMQLADGRTVRAVQAPVTFDGERLGAWSPPPAYEDGDAEPAATASDDARNARFRSARG